MGSGNFFVAFHFFFFSRLQQLQIWFIDYYIKLGAVRPSFSLASKQKTEESQLVTLHNAALRQ